ncbi:hypothetical protein BN1723_004251 [Verticillium longisporum]|uniref:PX-associated domain-containing protein n=1 Tax=Verticillium longisporum TaxID=100787 RepID=A0A0G4MSH7_VERLO|nr:hypothetical protein BN1723_004251 [Verticillium longisporum]
MTYDARSLRCAKRTSPQIALTYIHSPASQPPVHAIEIYHRQKYIHRTRAISPTVRTWIRRFGYHTKDEARFNQRAISHTHAKPLAMASNVPVPPTNGDAVAPGTRAGAELPNSSTTSLQSYKAPPSGQTLTGKQEHYLKRELISDQVKFEISELNSPTALKRFGAPFKSDYGEVSPLESELPILRYIFKSLADLSGFSNTTTRQLDETYYAVLEKTSALQVTVTAMRELATLSREIKGVFEAESQEMVRDVQAQVDSLGQFEEQKKRIVDLQGRIEAGRNKIQALSGRVDVVKERIEGWEKADREWQEKTRKRLKSLWIVMSVVFALLVLLLVGAKYAAPDTMAVGKHSLSGDDANESNYSGAEGSDDEPGLGLWEKRTDVQEDRLHFLDEL